jgi:SAM-dependent methyltransferase
MDDSTSEENSTKSSTESIDTSALYQKIYDENPWYGDADQGRCPGVRLLPKYRDWLIGPVLDLGCGRGHTVEHLRKLGFEAAGIDQIQSHPAMRVGNITQPIQDITSFNSVVCIDCIEHLYEDQVLGLFENMKQVQRQAFSIHIGESTGTGQELHVNRKSFSQWSELVCEHFEIVSEFEITPEQILYLTRSR